MRLVALHLTTGVNDLDDLGVWLPALGIAAALIGGGWAVQQAHAAGAPAVVVGCMTVIDPLVAVGLGIAMLGEGAGMSAATAVACSGSRRSAWVRRWCSPAAIPTSGRARRGSIRFERVESQHAVEQPEPGRRR